MAGTPWPQRGTGYRFQLRGCFLSVGRSAKTGACAGSSRVYWPLRSLSREQMVAWIDDDAIGAVALLRIRHKISIAVPQAFPVQVNRDQLS